MSDYEVLGLPLKVMSEDGNIYTLDVFQASGANVKYLWDMFHQFPSLFCDQTRNDYSGFVQWLLSPSTIVLTACVLEDDPIFKGIVYVTDMIPGLDAMAHYFFWDRVVDGRHRVLLRALRWGVDAFGLHRVSIEVPKHAYTTLHRNHKLGFRFEGVRKEAQLHKGKWHDVILFGVLAQELTDAAIERGRLDRQDAERGWFGFLSKESALMQFISKG